MNKTGVIILIVIIILLIGAWAWSYYYGGNANGTNQISGQGAASSSAPVAGPGEACGGNMLNAPVCGSGYTCEPSPSSTLPFGDVGGTCVPMQAQGNGGY